jgi:cytochrome c
MTFLVASHVAAHAGGDPVKGASAFHQCATCHAVGPDARVILGPPLNGIASRRWGSWPGYAYSSGLVAGGTAGRVWDDATLDRWITAPQKMVPGTKMAFGGLSSAQERADVIAYLKQFDRNGKKKQQ